MFSTDVVISNVVSNAEFHNGVFHPIHIANVATHFISQNKQRCPQEI